MGCPAYTYSPALEPKIKRLKKELTLAESKKTARVVYLYGSQGQIKDDEVYGSGNVYAFEYRMQDTRTNRFWSPDPLHKKYPYYSSYQFSGNRLIDMVELEGLEPTQSGSYGGQGAIAPKLDDKSNPIGGTEDQRWTWNSDQWNAAEIGITQKELNTVFPSGNNGLLKTLEITLNLEGANYGISSQTEMNAFIAQGGFETQGYTKLSEDVHRYTFKNLRSFNRLDKYSDEHLKSVVGKPDEVSVLLYGGSGKGIDYRGRGLVHTTWRDGYQNASRAYNSTYGTNYNFANTPALLATDHQIAVRTGLIFFKMNGLFGMRNFDIDKVSKKVNYYDEKSFPSRKALFQKVNSIVR